jgi:alpha-glucuronidase
MQQISSSRSLRTLARVPLLLSAVLGLSLSFACSSSDPGGGGDGGPGPGAGGVTSGGGSGGSGSTPDGGTGNGATGPGAGGGDSDGAGSGAAPSVGGSGPGAGGQGPGAGGSGESSGGSGSAEEYPVPGSLPDETGADLWLRYPKLPIPMRLAEYQAALKSVVAPSNATFDIAKAELVRGLSGLLGAEIQASTTVESGAVVVGTAGSDTIKDLPLASELAALGPEGYIVRAVDAGGKSIIAVAGNTEVGALYGTYALLRHLQTHSSLEGLSLKSSPRIQHRLLNHWDNLNRTVERGYAGQSLWDWNALPGTISQRYRDYARANASIGINGAVLTNVNADHQVLSASYISKVKALADVFRPYGIKVYLTARFSAPIQLGGLNTADPTNQQVQNWWKSKVDEIYAAIPDFGGFVVKANSEGQPGPQDYNRSHAQGANMLADAVGDRGIVMWRAFVYSSGTPADRIKQAYDEFKPLDGEFRSNAMVQVKNGPLDFQPREPFHPLFGAMPKTPLVLELQITKEYLGMDTHLAYLGPLFEETLKADTYAKGPGSTVAKVIDGSLEGHTTSAIAGVSNIGTDTNWTGSHMNQANWYVFGRMAWDPEISSEAVAEEWVRQTFSNDPTVVTPVVQMMMLSREAVVNYMTPLGLAHIMGDDDHYGPEPWSNAFADHPEWNPVYYHKADAAGIGFDRTPSGSNAVAQYASEVGSVFANRATVPDEFLLFFHHAGWEDKVSSGRTVWDELVHRYSQGVDEVDTMKKTWAALDKYIDAKRFGEVADFLQIQHYEARWWRDACLTYFATFSKKALSSGYAPAANNLSFYQSLDAACPANVTKPRCNQVYTGEPSPAILP